MPPSAHPAPSSPDGRLAAQVAFIAECDKLKEIFRQTINTQSRRAENDAEHSWAFTLCVIVLAEHANAAIDVQRVVQMAIIHDLVEIDAGDTFAYDAAAVTGQHDREARAADRVFGLLPPDQARGFRALWDEFEARTTMEAKFAHACDRFQPMLLNARTEGGSWRAHGITHDQARRRGAPVADGSTVLWEKIEAMLREAVAAGHLAPAAGRLPAPGVPGALSAASERLSRQAAFIIECDKLKEIFRQNINTQSRRAENDAEHSWHLALCVMVLAEHANANALDVLRVLKMVIIHDLVEIDAGDTFAHDAASTALQHERETRAADRIFGLLPPDQAREFRALWDEFEARETPEAKFAHACDRFQPILLNTHSDGGSWHREGITHERVVRRTRSVADGSLALGACVDRMLVDAVTAGYLTPAK